MISSSIVAIIMLLSFPIYKYFYQNSFIYYPLLACIPLIFFSNTSGVMKGYLEGINNFHTTYISNFLESLAKILFTVILLYLYKSYSPEIQVLLAFISLASSEAISLIYLAFKIKKYKKSSIKNIETNGLEKDIFKQALPLTLEGLTTTIGGWITPFIFYDGCKRSSIDFYSSTSYYNLAQSYAIPLLFSGQFAMLTIAKFIYPSISKNLNDLSKIHLIFNKSLIIGLLLSIFCFTLCFTYPKEALNILYGNTKSESIVIFLAPLYFFIYFDPIFIIILQSFKKGKALLAISTTTQILSMILIYLLSSNPIFNTTGYVIGLSIAYLVKFVLLVIVTLKTIKYKITINKNIIFLLLSLLYFLLVYFIRGYLYYFILSTAFLLLYLPLYYFLNNKKSRNP
jgi:stage V sporulation protein B